MVNAVTEELKSIFTVQIATQTWAMRKATQAAAQWNRIKYEMAASAHESVWISVGSGCTQRQCKRATWKLVSKFVKINPFHSYVSHVQRMRIVCPLFDNHISTVAVQPFLRNQFNTVKSNRVVVNIESSNFVKRLIGVRRGIARSASMNLLKRYYRKRKFSEMCGSHKFIPKYRVLGLQSRCETTAIKQKWQTTQQWSA